VRTNRDRFARRRLDVNVTTFDLDIRPCTTHTVRCAGVLPAHAGETFSNKLRQTIIRGYLFNLERDDASLGHDRWPSLVALGRNNMPVGSLELVLQRFFRIHKEEFYIITTNVRRLPRVWLDGRTLFMLPEGTVTALQKGII
jgi:hypothetical protein